VANKDFGYWRAGDSVTLAGKRKDAEDISRADISISTGLFWTRPEENQAKRSLTFHLLPRLSVHREGTCGNFCVNRCMPQTPALHAAAAPASKICHCRKSLHPCCRDSSGGRTGRRTEKAGLTDFLLVVPCSVLGFWALQKGNYYKAHYIMFSPEPGYHLAGAWFEQLSWAGKSSFLRLLCLAQEVPKPA
jgi:hypothetical protein